MRRTRKKSLIMAVARPKYPAGKVTISLDTLEKGSRGAQVKALQILLIGAGHSCGKAGADGVYGSGTLAAVKEAQKQGGLIVDGIAGKNTWTLLLGA
jgi:peptidoglycan hydrolase-like protein with peptidoglycan-binding domain